jgi:hypothetical protein
MEGTKVTLNFKTKLVTIQYKKFLPLTWEEFAEAAGITNQEEYMSIKAFYYERLIVNSPLLLNESAHLSEGIWTLNGTSFRISLNKGYINNERVIRAIHFEELSTRVETIDY